jgi:hypothetical protein
VLFGDSCDAGDELAVDACRQLNGRVPGAQGDEVPGRDSLVRRVDGRELDLWTRPLERELADTLDGGTGEEGAVAQELEAARFQRPARCCSVISLTPANRQAIGTIGATRSIIAERSIVIVPSAM